MKSSIPYHVFAVLIASCLNFSAIGQTNQTVQNGATTTAVVFPASCHYNWTCDHPEIGLAATGSGNIAAFTAVNTGPTPITATVTATPSALHPDYAYVPSMTYSMVHVINTATNTIVASLNTNISSPDATIPSPDGSTMYIAGWGGVDAINTNTNTLTHLWTAPNSVSFFYGGVVSPDGSTLYALDNLGGTLYRIDIATGTTTGTLGAGTTPVRITISPDGSRLYVVNNDDNILVIDAATFTVLNTIPLPGVDQNIVISPDGGTLYVGGNGYVYFISTATNAITASVPALNGPLVVNLSPDGSRLYVSQQTGNTITVINTTTQAILATIPAGTDPTGTEIDPGNGYLYVVNYNSAVSVIDLTTNTVVTTIAITNGNAQFTAGNFIGHYSCTGSPITFTITVNPSVPVITPGVVTGAITSCAGTASSAPALQQFTVTGNYLSSNLTATAPNGFEISLTPGSGYASSVILSPVTGTVSTTTLYVRAAATAPAGSVSGNVVLSTTGAPDQNVAVTATITPLVTPGISIIASANNICAGSPVTFTASVTDGGNTPIYQWRVNGTNTGTNSTFFSSTTLNNNDLVSCLLTSDATCLTTSIATSNGIPMQVAPLVSPTISIIPSTTSICAGSQVTFTATPSNGGSTPVYQWRVNGTNTGTNSTFFSSTTLNNNDLVSCLLTSDATCLTTATATSNGIPMQVVPLVSPTVSIIPSTTSICAGSPVTFTASVTDGGSAPQYQWIVNGSHTGANSPQLTLPAPVNGEEVYCTVTRSEDCSLPGSATPVNITVSPIPTITFAPDTVFASSNGVMIIPTITGDIAVYQWTPGNGLNATDIADPLANPGQDMRYQLQVTTAQHCSTTATIVVYTGQPIKMPNGFTPNGDGHNDVFRIPPGRLVTLDNFSIFDRWGNTVFATRNPGEGWDGNIKNVPAEAGTYIYVIEGKTLSGKSFSLKGTVVLFR